MHLAAMKMGTGEIQRWVFTIMVVATAASPVAAAEAVFPDKEWEIRKPEEVGLDSAKLEVFAQKVKGTGVIIRNGYLVKSWGEPEKRADWASAGKPVMSTLLFFAVHERKLVSVDDLVRPWVRKRWPGKDLIEKDRTMTFRHLADMTSGYMRGEAPGTRWAYNDYGIKLYASLLTAVFGKSLDDAVTERLSALQFQDGGVFGSRGGFGVNASARDFARIGWFWMHRGRWRDKPLLPEAFFRQYLKPDVPSDMSRTTEEGTDYLEIGTHGGGSDQSDIGPGVYGFNWWFNEKVGKTAKTLTPALPRDAFHANGHWGKEVMVVIPSLQMVVAARGDWGGMDLRNTRLLMDAVVEKAP